TQERHARLESWARERFPMMEQVVFTWAGQVMETIDGLAFIGRNPLAKDNVFIVTGDSGMGMTHGTIAGWLLTDLIVGRETTWARQCEPIGGVSSVGTALKRPGTALATARASTAWASLSTARPTRNSLGLVSIEVSERLT